MQEKWLINAFFCPRCPNQGICQFIDKYDSIHWQQAIQEAQYICDTFVLTHEEFVELGCRYRDDGWKEDSPLWEAMRDYLDGSPKEKTEK